MSNINLTAEEIHEITGLVRKSAQVKELRRLGIPVKPRGDGTPLVARQAYLIAMGAVPRETSEMRVEPNLGALDVA